MCQASSNPPSQYIWLYNNSEIYSGPQLTITNILRIDTGYYACLAQNTYLNTRSKKNITLTVYCEFFSMLPSSWTNHLFFSKAFVFSSLNYTVTWNDSIKTYT